MSEAMKQAAEFNRYFTSMNGVDVGARVSVPRDEWRALYAAISQPAQVGEVTDDQIIAIKKASKAEDPTKPWGDTLAFARAILTMHQQVSEMERNQEWPLRARVWERVSTQEWVLEIEGKLGEVSMSCRHTQPLSVKFEDVPGLPTLYHEPYVQADTDGAEAHHGITTQGGEGK